MNIEFSEEFRKTIADILDLCVKGETEMQSKLKQEQRRKVMNEAERQYKQYVKIFARTYGTTIEEATETRMCKEYKKYCEEVFSVGIPDEISNE